MKIPLHVALPLLVVFAVAGWAAGGIHTERRIAFEWTYNSVNFETKGNREQ